MTATITALEKHYTPNELGKLWGMHPNTIRRMFQDEPGVLKHGASFRQKKQGYVSLRIPESVAIRVHNEKSR